MKRILVSIPVLAGLVLVAAQPAMAKSSGAHHAKGGQGAACAKLTAPQLDTLFTKFNDAWATKNPDTVTALFDDDAVLLATVANVPRTDHAGIRDYFVKFLKNSPVGTINTSTVKSGCNWAVRAGTWTVVLTDPNTGAKTDVRARYSFLYQFEDGQWKIEHLHSSAMPEKV